MITGYLIIFLVQLVPGSCTVGTRQLYSWYPAVVQLVPGSCTVGTRQGCGASPLLFYLVINDLVNHLKNSFDKGIFISEETCDLYALMYADDISSMSDNSIQLQRQINCIAVFCYKVKLKVNIDKTKIVVFRNGGSLRKYEKWHFKNVLLESVSFYKYLGVYMTPKLSWAKTHECSIKQANKAIACIFNYQMSFGYFRPNEIFKLFDSMVRPILCYGAQVWGYQYNEKVESLHLSFCKRYCLLPQQTTSVFVYSECGRLPLCTYYMTQSVKCWIKLLRMDTIHSNVTKC